MAGGFNLKFRLLLSLSPPLLPSPSSSPSPHYCTTKRSRSADNARRCNGMELPQDLLIALFSYLAPSELLSVAVVSSAWLQAARSDAVWARLVRAHQFERAHNPPLAVFSDPVLGGGEPLWRLYCLLARTPTGLRGASLALPWCTSLGAGQCLQATQPLGNEFSVAADHPFPYFEREPLEDEEGFQLPAATTLPFAWAPAVSSQQQRGGGGGGGGRPPALLAGAYITAYYEVCVQQVQRGAEDWQAGEGGSPEAPAAAGPIRPSIAIGLASKAHGFPLGGVKMMPGWAEHSYGFHSDDGRIYTSPYPYGVPWGPTFGAGDVVGCGLTYLSELHQGRHMDSLRAWGKGQPWGLGEGEGSQEGGKVVEECSTWGAPAAPHTPPPRPHPLGRSPGETAAAWGALPLPQAAARWPLAPPPAPCPSGTTASTASAGGGGGALLHPQWPPAGPLLRQRPQRHAALPLRGH